MPGPVAVPAYHIMPGLAPLFFIAACCELQVDSCHVLMTRPRSGPAVPRLAGSQPRSPRHVISFRPPEHELHK